MLVVSKSYQNYQNGAESNQLTREGKVRGDRKSVEGIHGYSFHNIV
jgi:hypothetical protein